MWAILAEVYCLSRVVALLDVLQFRDVAVPTEETFFSEVSWRGGEGGLEEG